MGNTDLANQRSILYVEDDQTLAHLVKRLLGKEGYFVQPVTDDVSALDAINNNEFDLIILDYHLESQTGLDVLQALKAQSVNTPAIMVSGQEDIRVAVKALTAGCMDYLVKDGHAYLQLLPFHINTIFERLELSQQKIIAEQANKKAQESLFRAQKLARMGNWEWSLGDESVWWSDELYIIFGLDKEDFPSGISLEKFRECIHHNDVDEVISMEQKAYDGITSEFEYRILLPDSSIRWVHAINYVKYDDQTLIHMDGTIQDITERKASEHQLLLAQRVFDSTTEAIMVANAERKIISVNPAFTQITGYAHDEVIGKTDDILKSGKHSDEFFDEINATLLTKGAWAGELWHRNKAGEIYPEWLSINVIYDSNGEVDQYVSLFSDITQHKKAEQIIEYQANYDALTNLPNRNLFNDRLNSAIKKATRDKTKLALFFLDLDKFKWVNDTLGHRAGDELLQKAAQRLSSVIRETDSVARLGGDEFTVLLSDLENALDAEIIAEKILFQLAQHFSLETSEVFISGSIGITIFPDDATDVESLFKNADTAMYSAKSQGRNRYAFFTSDMQHEADKRLYMLNELQSAVKNQHFKLYYQPIIDINTGELFGAEALLRWPHPSLGFISPSQFIPLAEDTGLIQSLGEWVMTTALEQLKQWQDDGHEIQLSINKSSKQFYSEECANDLYSQIKQLGVDPRRLGIELTETALMEQQDLLTDLLSKYSEFGIALSLDDFGIGYASLSYLRQYPFDILKIDKSFIDDLPNNQEHATLVKTIIIMGHNLGLKVLAEGVESEAQKLFLSEAGCDLIQGYFYSPAIPAEQFEQQYFFNKGINQSW